MKGVVSYEVFCVFACGLIDGLVRRVFFGCGEWIS